MNKQNKAWHILDDSSITNKTIDFHWDTKSKVKTLGASNSNILIHIARVLETNIYV